MTAPEGMKIRVLKNGPLMVEGNIPLLRIRVLTDEHGDPYGWEEVYRYPDKARYTLCRCGKSESMPFCDGAHLAAGFDGTCVAPHETYTASASVIDGDGISLLDSPELCMGARFCHRGGGVWSLTRNSADPKARDLAIEEAQLCPSGRLTMFDNVLEETIEVDYEPSIALIEDPFARASSAIWVRGNIPLFDDEGTQYEARNYMTLCRCGRSRNMPFCDGIHYRTRFDDGHIFD